MADHFTAQYREYAACEAAGLLNAGLMLAMYWAAHYFAPVGLSLWMAKQARKHGNVVSAVVVMAASYAASMAVAFRLFAGSTSTIRLQYPLFIGNVTVPRIVAKWIRHHNSLAKLLTKTVSTVTLSQHNLIFCVHEVLI